MEFCTKVDSWESFSYLHFSSISHFNVIDRERQWTALKFNEYDLNSPNVDMNKSWEEKSNFILKLSQFLLDSFTVQGAI